MAEEQGRLPLAPRFGATLGRLNEHRAVALALRWYGVPLSALFGFVAAMYYVISPEHLRRSS